MKTFSKLEVDLLHEEYGRLYEPGGRVKAALVYPNSYYLGMSSLGLQVICHELNRHHDVSCERVFLHENEVMPRSLETRRPLSEFDIIGFSISFELDYFNVLKILYSAEIPLRAKDRYSKYPIIIAGGMCPTINPEPLAEFIDAFVIGDGEEVIHELISEYQDCRRVNRQDMLIRLSRIKGVYVPLLYDADYKEDGTLSGLSPPLEVERRTLGNLDDFDTVSGILTPYTEFSNTFLVEVTKGCAHRCRFCVASHVQKCRIRSAEKIKLLAQNELSRKAEKIGLVGSSVTDHPQIDNIVSSLINMGKKISVASMRADSISDALLDALASSGQETITLAPEAATERLRKITGKDIPLEAVFEVIRSALKKGILNVKLYFMIGLPGETQEDVDSIVTMAEHTRKLMFDSPRPRIYESPRLIISISPFVPKPHTPFQWHPMERTKILSQKLQLLRRKLGKIGGIKFAIDSAKWSTIQGILARGDRRLGRALYDMQMTSVSWDVALKKNNLSQEFYLHRPRQIDELFPWDHLSLGVSKNRLMEQYKCIQN